MNSLPVSIRGCRAGGLILFSLLPPADEPLVLLFLLGQCWCVQDLCQVLSRLYPEHIHYHSLRPGGEEEEEEGGA